MRAVERGDGLADPAGTRRRCLLLRNKDSERPADENKKGAVVGTWTFKG